MALENLLISSDAPADKVIYQLEYSVTLASFAFSDDHIPHNLGFTPLMNAQWSTSPTFDTSYNISGGPLIGPDRAYNTGIDADGTNVNISTFNRTGSSVTLYFRAYGLMPSNASVDVPFTSFAGDDFIINSDYNYTKLLLEGIQPLPAGTATYTIPHNLGYKPQVGLWITNSSIVTAPYILNTFGVLSTGWVVTRIDDNNLYIDTDATTDAMEMHYRIYSDRQLV